MWSSDSYFVYKRHWWSEHDCIWWWWFKPGDQVVDSNNMCSISRSYSNSHIRLLMLQVRSVLLWLATHATWWALIGCLTVRKHSLNKCSQMIVSCCILSYCISKKIIYEFYCCRRQIVSPSHKRFKRRTSHLNESMCSDKDRTISFGHTPSYRWANAVDL